jgi:putative hemolysin
LIDLEVPDSDPYLYAACSLAMVISGAIPAGILMSFVVILVLLFFSALISGSEVAFFSLSPGDLAKLRVNHSRVNREVLELLEKPKRLLATILITNNFLNVAIVIISAFVSVSLFDFSGFPVLGFIIEVIVITLMLLLFGEILPKIYANQTPVAFASMMATPMKFLVSFVYPFSSILVRTTSFIDKKVGTHTSDISMSELSDAIDITSNSNAKEEDTRILKGIVKFTDIEVKEIMKSRLDIVAIESDTIFSEVLAIIKASGYSRIPVYTESLDKIDGVLYVKDLIPHLDAGEQFSWITLIRTAFFVPENKKLNDLLKEMQQRKIHLAIVVDEYGGTSGLVTLEDIIEEIVGDISDEFDSPEDEIGFSRIDDNNFIFEAKTSINDFCKIIGVDDNIFDVVKGDADSIAGIILELLGRMPEKNTIVSYGDYTFKVLTVDKRRIKVVKVTLNLAKENQ